MKKRAWTAVGGVLLSLVLLSDPAGADHARHRRGPHPRHGPPRVHTHEYGHPLSTRRAWVGMDDPRQTHGHTGRVARFGQYATPPGHWNAGYLRPVGFMPTGPERRHLFEFEEDEPWGR